MQGLPRLRAARNLVLIWCSWPQLFTQLQFTTLNSLKELGQFCSLAGVGLSGLERGVVEDKIPGRTQVRQTLHPHGYLWAR